MSEPKQTIGAKRLIRWLDAEGLTYKRFAARLNVDKHSPYRWCAGLLLPSWRHMEAIAVVTDGAVRPDDWMSDEARKRLNEGNAA